MVAAAPWPNNGFVSSMKSCSQNVKISSKNFVDRLSCDCFHTLRRISDVWKISIWVNFLTINNLFLKQINFIFLKLLSFGKNTQKGLTLASIQPPLFSSSFKFIDYPSFEAKRLQVQLILKGQLVHCHAFPH